MKLLQVLRSLPAFLGDHGRDVVDAEIAVFRPHDPADNDLLAAPPSEERQSDVLAEDLHVGNAIGIDVGNRADFHNLFCHVFHLPVGCHHRQGRYTPCTRTQSLTFFPANCNTVANPDKCNFLDKETGR